MIRRTKVLSARTLTGSLLALLCFGCQATTGEAHRHDVTVAQGSHQVVPAHEKAIAVVKELSGPTKTQGISGVQTLVGLALASEFPGMTGQQLRARELVIQPGAVVAVHQHDKRPGFAYILEGEMVEHRNDQSEPIVRRVGDVAIERTGVSHWWENRSGKVARALVVDIVPAP